MAYIKDYELREMFIKKTKEDKERIDFLTDFQVLMQILSISIKRLSKYRAMSVIRK